MIGLIPTEGPIIVCLKVILVKLNSPTIISYRCIKVALLTISKATIVVKIGLTRLYVNGRSKALNSLIKVSPSV